MDPFNAASLVNLLGFTVGVALYGLLLAMVIRHRQASEKFRPDLLLLTAAVLGILWNVGELFTFIRQDFNHTEVSPLLTAISFSALGFLPSVVVHSSQRGNSKARLLTFVAYALSAFAAVLYLESAILYGVAPSNLALQVLTYGSLALLVGLLFFTFRKSLERKLVLASALGVFAVSALHLSGGAEERSWLIELVAHQCSLPLALALLLQDFRFAFADLFLKRALSLMLVSLAAFGLYVFIGVPLLSLHEEHARNDVQPTGIMLALWVATALAYPKLHQFAVWLVDKVVLRRANYAVLRSEIAAYIEQTESIEEILDHVCRSLSVALTAHSAIWEEAMEPAENGAAVNATAFYAEVFIPAVEAPYYKIILQDFLGGRNLLSDEVEVLESIALISARRIDVLRVTRQRHEQEMREQEFSKLATEAQLTSLRSQINPHFLFNALTTIGYLIQTAPDKAFGTLMRLTKLLRSLLSSTEEFCALGEEIKLIQAYLEIEQARFEERLEVEIAVAKDLENIRVPSLILQPLVENAIKHGISKMARGGRVEISARLENSGENVNLMLSVKDTGAGIDTAELPGRRKERIGLNNIEQRLRSYYGAKATLEIESAPGTGTTAKIILPVSASLERSAR
ncbi:MAG TPA: histidine kinase [Pyrinomonadaceae bacterium]|jgi:signal transduction histidine kinase|nr:histidine kinase [Pyrinomonadaceae bacterium]